jgi:hypothetical protein
MFENLVYAGSLLCTISFWTHIHGISLTSTNMQTVILWNSYLGYGTEPEDVRIPELCHILQAIGSMPKSVCHELIQAPYSLPCILRGLELFQLLCILSPDLLGPKHPAQHQRPSVATASFRALPHMTFRGLTAEKCDSEGVSEGPKLQYSCSRWAVAVPALLANLTWSDVLILGMSGISPGCRFLIDVFQVVSYDVGLLQK